MRLRSLRHASMYPLFLAPDAPAGGAAAPVESAARRVNTLTDRLIARHGSAEAALAVLASNNVTLEDEAVTSRNEINRLTALVPDPAKMVILPKERADLLNKYEGTKLTPEKVVELQTENGTLKGKITGHDTAALAAKGAPANGYDPEATADLIVSKNLHAELRNIEVEELKPGSKTEKVKVKRDVIFVRPATDDKAQLQPIGDYAKTLPAFEQRALKAAPPVGTAGAASTPTADTSATGTLYPDQSAAVTTADDAPAHAVLEQVRGRYPSPSELRKQATQEPAHAS